MSFLILKKTRAVYDKNQCIKIVFEILIVDPGKECKLTAAGINAIIWIPQILHHFYANKLNTTTAMTVTKSEVGMMALYTARYHIWDTG